MERGWRDEDEEKDSKIDQDDSGRVPKCRVAKRGKGRPKWIGLSAAVVRVCSAFGQRSRRQKGGR